jgi:zinc protease
MTKRPTVSLPDIADAPAPAPAVLAHDAPEVHGFVLANGLEVVVIPDNRAPVATHMIWYKVGSADEQPGKSGIAHFLEHLMFKGTKDHPAGEFSAVVASLGGQENAFTSYDYTAYFQRVPKAALKTVMGFEADRMSNLVLSDEVVNPERDVVLEERRMRTDSDPGAVLSETMDAALWLNQPYRMPVIGWEQEIRGLGRAEAIAFYDRFYTPANAVLVVAGDVTPDEVKALAEETYGAVENRFAPKPRARPSEPQQMAARRVALADPRVRQPMVLRQYLAPCYRTAEGGQAHALEVLSVILAGGSTSRLYTALVVDQAIAAGAGGYYWGTALDPSRSIPRASPSMPCRGPASASPSWRPRWTPRSPA